MKKTVFNRFSILLFLALCALTAACSKDKSTPTPELTAEELILGKWYIVKISKADGSIYEPANDCEKESHYRLDDENEIDLVNFYLDDGECKRSGGWGEYYLIDDGTKLIITASDGVTSTIDVIKLNESTMELKIGGDTLYLKKGG